jgi:hypothetical protein
MYNPLLNPLPLLDVEMAHPSALDAFRMTSLGVLPDEGPPELAAPSSAALVTAGFRGNLLHGVFDQRSSKNRQNEQRNEKEGHKIMIY